MLDVPYVRGFIKELAPAWLDHVAVLSGVSPPSRRDGFAWCDLGCGQGVTAAVLATLHPTGRFCGIDSMPEHVDHARRLSAACGLANAEFHASGFDAAAGLDLPQFDYIVVHGVYSWVDAQVRADLRAFIDRKLKPGGLVYVSYNAMPGRAADLPLQRLVSTFGKTLDGNGIERVTAAMQFVRSISELRVPALANVTMLDHIDIRKGEFAPAYLAHEFLAPHWEPLCVTEMRSDMGAIGLEPVGSATVLENYDTLVLKGAERTALSGIADRHLRELARDFFVDQCFRRDVFVRDARKLGADRQCQLMLSGAFGLTRQPSRIEYAMVTRAGRVAFDKPAARSIVAALASGPKPLGDIVQECGLTAADAMASALLLCASGQMHPAESSPAAVQAFNKVVRDRLNGPEEIGYMAMPFGTVIVINDALREILANGAMKTAADRSWQDFLAVHGCGSLPID